MGHDDPIQIPEHVTGSNREMFALIVRELKRRDTNPDAVDAFLVEKLASQLVRLREVDALVQFGYAIASAAEAIKTRCWLSACEFASGLRIPPDELKRLVLIN